MKQTLQKETADDGKLAELVEDALLKRATGYEDASGKTVPPDIRAAMYWLENRCPQRWKKNRSSAVNLSDETFSQEEEEL